MDITGLLNTFLTTTDTLVQVIATLYVAVAIFAGEQISSTFNGDSAPVRLKAKRYVQYLYLSQAVICAVGLPLVASLQTIDIFPAFDPPVVIKPLILSVVCAALATLLIKATFQTFLQTKIHKKYSKITDPQTRLIAWALDEENDPVEENKIIVSLLSRENDYDFELQLLRKLATSLTEVMRTKDKARAVSLVGSLRVLRKNLDKRPLEQPEYFGLLFAISHDQWLEALASRSELHEHKIYQLSSTLGKIGKELMCASLGKRSLAYDYFKHLETFVGTSDAASKEYFAQTGSGLLLETSRSPESSMIWADYFPSEWFITPATIARANASPAKLLFTQYSRLVNKVQREDSELEELMDDITVHLFPGVHTGLWADLMVLRYQYWPGTTAQEHIQYWLMHPKKFGLAAFGRMSDFKHSVRTSHIQEAITELEHATYVLAVTLELFPAAELTALIRACAKFRTAKLPLLKDYHLETVQDLETTLKLLQKTRKNQEAGRLKA